MGKKRGRDGKGTTQIRSYSHGPRGRGARIFTLGADLYSTKIAKWFEEVIGAPISTTNKVIVNLLSE